MDLVLGVPLRFGIGYAHLKTSIPIYPMGEYAPGVDGGSVIVVDRIAA